MVLKKIAVFSCISFFPIAGIHGQIPVPKNKMMGDSLSYHLYQQLLPDVYRSTGNSMFHQYESTFAAINPSQFPKSSVSEKLNTHLQRIPRHSYVMWPTRCPWWASVVKLRLVLGSEFVEKGPVIITKNRTFLN